MINLVIVGITQSIIVFLLFNKNESLSIERNILSTYLLLISCTIFITMGGYLINDYFDYEIDSINKQIKHRFGKSQLLNTYFSVNCFGFCIALLICSTISQYVYLLVYIVSIGLLFLYASHLKRKGLIGNVVVSLFSSLVIGLLWYVQEYFHFEISEFQKGILIFFMSFIFLASMARELVKDCEDIEGDKNFKLSTLPIKIGINKTKVFISFFLILLLGISLAWMYWLRQSSNIILLLILIPNILLNIYLIFSNFKSITKEDFTLISIQLKALMGLGIISLAIISYCA